MLLILNLKIRVQWTILGFISNNYIFYMMIRTYMRIWSAEYLSIIEDPFRAYFTRKENPMDSVGSARKLKFCISALDLYRVLRSN